MAPGPKAIRVLTTDESLLASTRAAAEALQGWEVVHMPSQEALIEDPPVLGDVLLLDNWLGGMNVYELSRTLTGKTRCRTWIVVERGNDVAEPIASFCGATGVLERPVRASALRTALDGAGSPKSPLPVEERGGSGSGFELPEALLVDITTGDTDTRLVSSLIDSQTGLFNYAFLNFKLDEEFKRARRFAQPLACVMLGFEGQADDDTLRELSSIFLETSRDTDVLGRFDENSFLFLLPNTGPDGALVMAQRVAEMAEERGLKDLVGDPLVISVGISSYPHPDLARREDLYGTAREAFFNARKEGGGVVCKS